MSRLEMGNKVAIITGATKGLGKALALTFAQAGYEIIGLYKSDSKAANEIGNEFHRHGLKGSFLKQDITVDGEWPEFDKLIESKSDCQLTLIANACSPFTPKPFHLNNWSDIAGQLEVGVKGAFLLLKRLLPHMARARGGTVIFVLSSVLNAVPKGFSAYATGKSALDGLAKVVASEYSTRGLRVFSVSPGFMDTSLTEAWSEHLKAHLYAQDGAVQQPDCYAEIVFNLAHDPEALGRGENYFLDPLVKN